MELKLNKSEIFTQAWARVKSLGENISTALKAVWAKIKNETMKNFEKLSEKARDFIQKHYGNNNYENRSICFGVGHSEKEAHELINENFKSPFGWNVGDVVDGKEVFSVTRRVDLIDESIFHGESQQVGESFVEFIKRISKHFYYTASVTRLFRNPLNGIYTYDDEINGATILK